MPGWEHMQETVPAVEDGHHLRHAKEQAGSRMANTGDSIMAVTRSDTAMGSAYRSRWGLACITFWTN